MQNRSRSSWYALTIIMIGAASASGGEPKQGNVTRAELSGDVVVETVYIPPGEFLMGSTPEEKRWATGIEGGAGRDRTRIVRR